MKKTFKIVTILLLIVAFAFCLFACNKDEQKPEESSDTTVVMTESYERGRAEFKAVTGIELPALADITVEEFPYEEGARKPVRIRPAFPRDWMWIFGKAQRRI